MGGWDTQCGCQYDRSQEDLKYAKALAAFEVCPNTGEYRDIVHRTTIYGGGLSLDPEKDYVLLLSDPLVCAMDVGSEDSEQDSYKENNGILHYEANKSNGLSDNAEH